MECMKCGREVASGQVFCESCRADMEGYPVKPDVVVQLPQNRSPEMPKKAPSRRPPLSDQEQLRRLRLRSRVLGWCLAISMLLCCLLAFAVGLLYRELEEAQNLGKNYSTVESGTAQPRKAN